MSIYLHKGHTMLLTSMIAYIAKQVKRVEQPVTYGSELEQYIISKRPQSVAEIEHWTRQFDKNTTQRGWPV